MRGTHFVSLVDWTKQATDKGLKIILTDRSGHGEFYQAVNPETGESVGYFNLWLSDKEHRRVSGGEL